MPQLPSGRQVAVTFAPLTELLKAADSPFNSHKIMAIEQARDLWPYLSVLFLVPEADAADAPAAAFRDDALPRPPGLMPVDSGFRLSDWDALTQDWSGDDRAAMREFLETRAACLFDEGLELVRTTQRALLAAPGTMAGAFAIMWQQGCHPLQDDWAEDLPDSPEWDDYDMLAALAIVHATVAGEPDVRARHPAAFERLLGIWPVLAGIVGVRDEPVPANGTLKSLSGAWRDRSVVEHCPADRRDWLHDQLVIECVNLWNHAGEVLKAECPSAYGILSLVTISPEGTSAS